MLYYEKIVHANAKGWVLFIHGLGGSIRTWKYQLEQFSKNYNLLLVDLDGHGKSNMESAISEYKPTGTAQMIHDILVREKIERTHIVSLSLGTLIALEYIRLHPERVFSVILAGSVINLDFIRKIVFHIAKFTTNTISVDHSYPFFAHIIMPWKNHKLSRDIFIREAKKLNQQVFQKWVECVGCSNEKVMETFRILNANKIPALFISGKQDYMFADGVRDFCLKSKEFKLKILENAGHVCSIEAANKFNNMAIEFLDSLYAKVLK